MNNLVNTDDVPDVQIKPPVTPIGHAASPDRILVVCAIQTFGPES